MFLANPDLADTILFSLIKVAESNESSLKDGYGPALNLFEEIFAESPQYPFSSCAAVLGSDPPEIMQLRLECMAALERALDGVSNGKPDVWSEQAQTDLIHAMLFDPGVRIRRGALQILAMSPTLEDCFLTALVMKTRDVDKKVRLAAFQALLDFPMNVLWRTLSVDNWAAIFWCGFASEDNQSKIYKASQCLLLKYLTPEDAYVLPSTGLQQLSGVFETLDELLHALRGITPSILEKEV